MGILNKEIQGRNTLFNLNYDHPNLIDYITMIEKFKLIKLCENNKIIKELVNTLRPILKGSNLTLIFGSASHSPNKANDIDLLITGKTDKKILEKFSNRWNKKIHLINLKSLNNVTSALRQEIISKHVIISGSEDIIRWLLW